MSDKIGKEQEAVLIAFAELILKLEAGNPVDGSPKHHWYSIVTSEVEQIAAVFKVYACEPITDASSRT